MSLPQGGFPPQFPVVALHPQNVDEVLMRIDGKPNPARVYDYFLHGATNSDVDRRFAEKQLARWPELPMIAISARGWLHRAVSYLVRMGIRQVLDLGCGLPADMSNVHELCEQQAPGQVRVVYVDHDPVAATRTVLRLEHDRLLERHGVILGDLREADTIWQTAVDHQMLDPDRPVGIVLSAVLEFVSDTVDTVDDRQLTSTQAIGFLRRASAPGSALAISHATCDGMSAAQRFTFVALDYGDDADSSVRARLRTRKEIRALFGEWPLVPPGLDWTSCWWPGDEDEPRIGTRDGDPSRSRMLGGVAFHATRHRPDRASLGLYLPSSVACVNSA